MPSLEPADAPTQSFTAAPQAALVPQRGSAESKTCADELSAAWLCDTGSYNTTVTLPPRERHCCCCKSDRGRCRKSGQRESAKLFLLSKQVPYSGATTCPFSLHDGGMQILLILSLGQTSAGASSSLSGISYAMSRVVNQPIGIPRRSSAEAMRQDKAFECMQTHSCALLQWCMQILDCVELRV